MCAQENPNQGSEVQEDVKDVNVYYFHSTPEKQHTFRQYSAAGYVDRTTDTNQPFVTMAYAVCSEKEVDAKGKSLFSKDKARLITSGRLQKGVKVHRLSITEEEFTHPARTIRDKAIRFVPGSTLPKQQHKSFLEYHNSMLDPNLPQVTNAAQILIQVPTEEELTGLSQRFIKELQTGITLGGQMQQNNPTAEA